jgi:hypothetical protein
MSLEPNPTPSVKPKKVAQYDGKTSWTDYKTQFELVAAYNGWDERRKAVELATNLSGDARSILVDMEVSRRLDYNALVHRLTMRFEPEDLTAMYQSQLKSRKRKRNESIPELVHDLKRLVRKAFPGADEVTRNYLAVASFMAALNDRQQELFVYQKEPRTVEDAGKAAMNYEAFESARPVEVAYVRRQVEVSDESFGSNAVKGSQSIEKRYFEQHPGGHENNPLLKYMEEIGKLIDRKLKQHLSNRRRPIVCFQCREEGHIARNCPKEEKKENVPQEGSASVPAGKPVVGSDVTQGNGMGLLPQA